MFPGRFIPSLLASVTMYGLFYFWHGSVLNDFIRLDVNLNLFYTLSAITYFIFGWAISFLHGLTFFKYHLPGWARILLTGFIVGLSGYAISVVLPVSVSRTFHLMHVLLDVSWQIAEETAGSFVYFISLLLLERLGLVDTR
jgi:hypothetical protein